MPARKMATAGYLTQEQRDAIELMKERGYIKSLSAGIRKALEIYINKNKDKIKPINQKKITEY